MSDVLSLVVGLLLIAAGGVIVYVVAASTHATRLYRRAEDTYWRAAEAYEDGRHDDGRKLQDQAEALEVKARAAARRVWLDEGGPL